jgi:GDPmannose 4,6-dehydratase
MKTVLITGITGQDGYYLSTFLLRKGYRVIGTTRDVESAARHLAHLQIEGVELVCWDLLNPRDALELLSHYRPSELYNLAGYSSGAGMYDETCLMGQVNGNAVACILEAIREIDTPIRFCQASSSEMFGDAVESPQSEETPFRPRSPYGAAKAYAHYMINIYRQHYGLFACSAILFNHESPLRRVEFVTRKITHTAARIKLGLAKELLLGNLNARRDWGFAGDYVHAMWLALQRPHAEDYVVSTGEAHSVREFCQYAFDYVGLDYQQYLREDASAYRPDEPTQLVGNSEKARMQLGWLPQVGFRKLVEMMVEAELRVLRNGSTDTTR